MILSKMLLNSNIRHGAALLATVLLLSGLFPVGAFCQGGAMQGTQGGGRPPVDSVLMRRLQEASSLQPGESLGGIHVLDGAFIRPLQKRDTVLIGDQVLFGFTLKDVEEGTLFALPELGRGQEGGIEVLTPWTVDTLSLPRKLRGRSKTPAHVHDLEFRVLVTSFDEADYGMPRIPVRRILPTGEVDTLLFQEIVMPVRTMPVDTATFVAHDIKGQVRYPVTVQEVMPWALGGWLFAVVAILAVCLIVDYRKRKAEGGGEVHHDPAHIVALRKLEHLRGEGFWVPEKQKFFYSSATDALREYMVARYGIGAMEMTTAEIFSALKEDSDMPGELRDELRVLFERSDFVKFAKYTATPEENAQVLPLAVRFVTTTYQSQLEEEEEKTKAGEAEGGKAEGEDRQGKTK